MKQQNCWDVNRCGRQAGGEKAATLGVCPAALPGKFDGINQGERGGRFCWAIVGTFCGGNIKGTFAEKIMNCLDCGFLQSVREEEQSRFKLTRQDAYDFQKQADSTLLQQTAALAQKVFIFLVKQEIPATPENYEVWFAYHSNNNEDLEREVREKISKGIPLDRELTMQLHERYFGDQDKQRIIALVENHAVIIMKEVIDSMLISVHDSSEYNKKLQQYSLTLKQATDIESVKYIINTLISDTKEFEESNVKLRHKLEHITAEAENLKKQLEQHKQDLLKDPLTGLNNRRALSNKLEELHADFKKNGSIYSAIMTDINLFKKFNDQYGHIIGDNALQIVSTTLKENTKGKDFVGRFGGDEFILLLPETTLYSATILAGNLGRSVSEKKLKLKSTGKTLEKVSISLGVAQIKEGDLLESVVERADAALNLAKTSNAMVKSEKDIS